MAGSRFKPKPLKDQVIVITGASSGVGLAVARAAARSGAKVVISSRNAEVLSEVSDVIRWDGGKVHPVVVDVSDLKQVEHLREEALRVFGTIDTWVNNAGISIFGFLNETPLEEEKRIFEVNFWGLRHGCRVAVPVLAQKGGVLINMGSELSCRSVPLQGMYCATKHAVKAYTDALRMELEQVGLPVRVSLIRPGSLNTPFPLHARNRLFAGEPSLAPPVYDPTFAAHEILKCAIKPKRDVYIGSTSRVVTLFEALIPRALDRYMERKFFEQQSRGGDIPHLKLNEALVNPPFREGQVHGGHKGHVFKGGS